MMQTPGGFCQPCDRCGKDQAERNLYPGGLCRICWNTTMDEIEGLRRATDQQRGYADFFDWSDKHQKERGILTMFVEALRKAGGVISDEHLTERDPPDAVALSETRAKIGIGLVELVD